MARAYLKFTRKGDFTYKGGVAIDVEDPTDLKSIWAAAHDMMFSEYIVREREYDNEEWGFELMSIETPDPVVAND